LTRPAWRAHAAPKLPPDGRLISLFCYEPDQLPHLLRQLAGSPDHLLVTPGRPLAAVQQALAHLATPPNWSALPYTSQDGFDEMLWACDLNCVRGEDSLVRALWAGQPFVWHIYPQDDGAHHAKLEAFLDWLQAPESLRRFHRRWNGMDTGALAMPDADTLLSWRESVLAARQRLFAQAPLTDQLIAQASARLNPL
ncbi:MAG: elongation factor P maturation arginine rhamnosyltransferase EarP, partial [Betaproteobacteria bacterium]|nr:elongation factor P maturation arginine rhamnosyltransferase EarP [Betaproteobacteria bacterium]